MNRISVRATIVAIVGFLLLTFALSTSANSATPRPAQAPQAAAAAVTSVLLVHHCQNVGAVIPVNTYFICLDNYYYRYDAQHFTLANQVSIGCKHVGVIVPCIGASAYVQQWNSGYGFQPFRHLVCGTYGGGACGADRTFSPPIPGVAAGVGTWTWNVRATTVHVNSGGTVVTVNASYIGSTSLVVIG